MRSIRWFIALAIGAGLAGCGPASDINAPPPITSQLVNGQPLATTGNELTSLLEAEKRRIAETAEGQAAVYDSLKAIWDAQADSPEDDVPTSGTSVLFCDPLQYSGETKIIGPAGGDMSIGPHKLSIPAGALSGYVVITGEMPVSLAVTVRFSPHGLRFLVQPTLTMSYKHCNRPPTAQERIAYINDDLQILEWPYSEDIAAGEVRAWLDHFSRYAIAW